MYKRFRFTVLTCLLCCAAVTVCACAGIPDQLKTVRLDGAEKTLTVPLDYAADTGLALSVDLQFTDGGGNPITVLPVSEGETPHAVITYPEDFEDYGFSAVQIGDWFRLDTAKDYRFTTEDFSMTLYADVTAYELIGSLELTADAGGVPCETLKLDITGGAAVDMKNITADAVVLVVDGAADVVLAGTAVKLDAEINGAGALESTELSVSHAAIIINGVGAAEIACSETLDANINGAGTVQYQGEPTLTKTINGLGTVSKLPDQTS